MLKSQFISVLFILLLALSPIYGYFEYFQLVLTWPAFFCHSTRCFYSPTPNNFTIHGLWPDNHSRQLNYCDRQATFVDVPIGKKLGDLDKRWPQLKHSKKYGEEAQPHWREEFMKHGTCCKNLYNEDQYFDLAMNLIDRFDILRILGYQGIIPGNSYIVQKVQDAIMTVTHNLPKLQCLESALGFELSEVVICFDTTGKYVVSCRKLGTCFNKGTMSLIKFRR